MIEQRGALALAAQALIGVPFRLHGRDPRTGLDCIGLACAAMAAIGRPLRIPACYGLRNSDIGGALAHVDGTGLVEAPGPIEPGDVLLTRLSPLQVHLLIAAFDNRFIHAHAGLRRVAATPGPLTTPVIRHWRLPDQS